MGGHLGILNISQLGLVLDRFGRELLIDLYSGFSKEDEIIACHGDLFHCHDFQTKLINIFTIFSVLALK